MSTESQEHQHWVNHTFQAWRTISPGDIVRTCRLQALGSSQARTCRCAAKHRGGRHGRSRNVGNDARTGRLGKPRKEKGILQKDNGEIINDKTPACERVASAVSSSCLEVQTGSC